MIILSLDFDASGRPIVDLYASVSRPRAESMAEAGEGSPLPVPVRALVDKGASRSVVQASISEALGLDPVGVQSLHTASTGGMPKELNVYAINLFVAGLAGATLDHDLRVLEIQDLSGLGVEMLLGACLSIPPRLTADLYRCN
jgi:hypothetical protein